VAQGPAPLSPLTTAATRPPLKVFLRCGEAETASWVSKMIGEEERERPRVGATATVRSGGRDSVNYSTHTERRALISKEEVMSLANLTGYWKYGRSVVPFRLEPHTPPQVTRPFVPRVPVKADRPKATSKTYLNFYGERVTSLARRAGYDATFSAPKSVSLAALVGGDARVAAAHREAVTVAFNVLEERARNPRTAGWLPGNERDEARPVNGNRRRPRLGRHSV
jgi:hypothetical protein